MDIHTFPIPFIILTASLFGLILGSFFNVVIYRMPRGESVVWPGSHCTRCGHTIRLYENIPVLSWIYLRGKCSACRSPIGMLYPFVEAVTGIITVLMTWFFLGKDYPLGFALAMAFFVLAAIPIFIIDFKHFLIPDIITFPGMFLGLGFSFLPGGLSPLDSIIGGIGSGTFLWLIGFLAGKALKKEAMGFGDVKLLAMAGSLFGLKAALLGLLFASFLGCLAGFPLLILKRRESENRIPFGPYICMGVVLAGMYGEEFLKWYFNLLQA